MKKKLYFLKGFNPLPPNDRFEEEYTFSLFLSFIQGSIRNWKIGLWNYETEFL